MFRDQYFLKGLGIFLILQIVAYLFLLFSHQNVPFNKYLYSTGFHAIEDTRTTYQQFNLFNALSAWDGQWYYRIAHAGYTTREEVRANAGRDFLDQFAYAFLPLYPYTVAMIDLAINNTLVSFFVVSNGILIGIFFALYYVVVKHMKKKDLAMRTCFLALFFPLALFYRAYYAEGLFLLLLIWFSYALIKRHWWQVSFSLTLLFLTKINGVFLLIPLVYVLWKEVKKKKLKKRFAVLIFLAPFSAAILLYLIGESMMNSGSIWIHARTFWGPKHSVLQNIITNVQAIVNFYALPWHEYKPSQTEIIAFVVGIVLLVKSKKILKPELWWIAFSLSMAPLLVKNFTSYARYELVIFPFFIYLAYRFKGIWFYVIMGIFYVYFLWLSVHFINWSWIE